MAEECIVKVPSYSVYDDYDFIGFSFNGHHCVEELNIIRVNGGSMYSENLTPQIQEKSGQHPGVEGAYLLDIQHRQRVFDVNIAFDSLTDEQLYKLKEVFAGKEVGELWFDEYPYKVWDAKVTGQPMLKVIPFGDDNGPTIYKGEGTIQFTAYYPYAHTPDFVYNDGVNQGDGRLLNSYNGFKNIDQWKEVANLWEWFPQLDHLDIRGEAPTYLSGKYKNSFYEEGKRLLGTVEIEAYKPAENKLTLTFNINEQELQKITQIDFLAEVQENEDPFFDDTILFLNGQWQEGWEWSVGIDYEYILTQSENTYQYDFINLPWSTGASRILVYYEEQDQPHYIEINNEILKGGNYELAYLSLIEKTKQLEIYKDNIIFYHTILPTSGEYYLFNTKTGIIQKEHEAKAQNYQGKIFGTLEPDEKYVISAGEIKEVNYRFWYY